MSIRFATVVYGVFPQRLIVLKLDGLENQEPAPPKQHRVVEIEWDISSDTAIGVRSIVVVDIMKLIGEYGNTTYYGIL